MNNLLTVTSDEAIESLELTVYIYLTGPHNEVYSTYADQIKGTPYIKNTITF